MKINLVSKNKIIKIITRTTEIYTRIDNSKKGKRKKKKKTIKRL